MDDKKSAEEKPITIFDVGDRVHYGWNGDYNPGVVVRVTPARVEVRELDLATGPKARNRYGDAPGCEFIDGDTDVSFIPLEDEYARVTVFTRRKNGTYQEKGCSRTLFHGARYSRNPSF